MQGGGALRVPRRAHDRSSAWVYVPRHGNLGWEASQQAVSSEKGKPVKNRRRRQVGMRGERRSPAAFDFDG